MKSQNVNMLRITSFIITILFLGLITALMTHAQTENYKLTNTIGDGQLGTVTATAVDSSGNVYVANYVTGIIKKFNSSGIELTNWSFEPAASTTNPIQMGQQGIGVDSSGNVYVMVGTAGKAVIERYSLNNTVPEADFTSNITTGNVSLTVQFIDKSTGSPISWQWDFGDGSTSTMQNPTHTYSKAGNYTVSLTANNSIGSNTAKKLNYITVIQKLFASFKVSPTSGVAPLQVTFTDTTTGIPTSWLWDFGDKTNSTSKNVVHTYNQIGNYSVSLTVKNAVESNMTMFRYIVVSKAAPPNVNFSATPTSGYAPLTVKFIDSSYAFITSWTWNFGDGNTSTLQNNTHTYTKAGNYTVNLTVTNAAGSTFLSKPNYIIVKTKPPVANFSATPISGNKPLSVKLTDTSVNNPTSWSWIFGDGGTSIVQNPMHNYTNTGNYTVSLTVKNAGGNNSIIKSKYITVK